MEKKQLYTVMIVSVLMLLGLIGYRWIKGDDGDAPKPTPAKKMQPAMQQGKAPQKGAPQPGKKAPGKPAAGVTVKPGGPMIGPAGVSAADLKFEGLSSVKMLRAKFWMAVDRKQPKPAQAILTHALSVAAKNSDVFALGQLACEHGFAAQADRAGQRLIAPAAVRTFQQAFLKALCAARSQTPAAGGPLLRRALFAAKSDLQRALVLAEQCRLLVDAKTIPQARATCKEALDKGGDQWAMFQAGRFELLVDPKSVKAQTLLDRALRLDPTRAPVARALGRLYVQQGAPEKAARALMLGGQALAKASRFHGARELYSAVVGLLPKLAAGQLGLARAERALGLTDSAVASYWRAAELAKGNVELRVELGQLLQRTDVLAAVRVLEDAVQIDPSSKSARRVLAQVRGLLAAKQPARQPEAVTMLEGKLLRMRFTSWGGTPMDLVLKGKKYQELAKGISKKARKGKVQQVNLVRTWGSYWLPFRLDFDGSSFRFPRTSGGWEYQSWARLRWDGKQFVLLQGKQSHAVKHRGQWVFGYRWPVSYPGMTPPEVVIDRIYRVRPDTSYAWDMEIKIVNRTTKAQTVKMKLNVPSVDTIAEERSFFNPISLKKEAVCMVGDKVFMRTLSSMYGKEGGCMGCDASTCACRRTPAKSQDFAGKVRWAGVDEMYFLLAVALNEKKDTVCQLYGIKDAKQSDTGVLMARLAFADQQILHKGSYISKTFKVFSGPKISEELDQVRVGNSNAKLTEAIDYGLFWFIGQPMIWMMKKLQKVVGNWGLAIIILTILIKLLTAPLTMKQMRSMKGMAKLKPELDQLKEKYGDDKQRFQQEMWALYKSHKINPLGGCLPMLLQMPIYIAWYQALMVSVDLYNAPLFGWIHDLTKPDAVQVFGYGIPILPIIMGAMMFLQQKMTPTTADNPQAKMMMYMMPAMFTFFMLFLPSGLTLYILTNTVLTMVHQWYMNHTD